MRGIFDSDGSGLVDPFTKFALETARMKRKKDEEGWDDNMKKIMKRVPVEH